MSILPRVYIGLAEDGKEIWRASIVAAECNFLITAEPSFSGQDPKALERYKAVLLALGKDGTKLRQLSKWSWIYSLDSRLNEVFQTLIDHLGVEHYAYTAVDLRSGEGLSFDAEKRVVCEFYAKNWIA
jgi:hypothetical protein